MLLHRTDYIPRHHPAAALRLPTQDDMPLHAHDFWEVQVVTSGESQHLTPSMRHRITRGDVFVIPPGLQHGYEGSKGFGLINFLYMPDELAYRLDGLRKLPGYHLLFEIEPRQIAQHHVTLHARLNAAQIKQVATLADAIAAEARDDLPGAAAQISALFHQFQITLSRIASAPPTTDAVDPERNMGELLSYMQTHFDEPLTVDNLAKIAGVSRSTVTRFFRDHLGRAPMQHLIELRLEHAKEALRHSETPITRIAFDCGFEDSNYFSRTFKQRHGITPRAYRKIYRA